jgi:hypothetical protein
VNPLRWLWRQMFVDDDSPPPDPDQLVLLAEPDGEIVAGLWEGILKDKGIGCVVKNRNAIAYLRSNAIPMFELHVLYRDLDRARQLLGLAEDDG